MSGHHSSPAPRRDRGRNLPQWGPKYVIILVPNFSYTLFNCTNTACIYEVLAAVMPSHATKTAEEASGANREALRGGFVGAAKVLFSQ